MFQFPRFPPPGLSIQPAAPPHPGRRVAPFGYPRIDACSPAPRGFSQCAAPFLGLQRPGIPHVRSLAYGVFYRLLLLPIIMHATSAATIPIVDVERGPHRRGRTPDRGTALAGTARADPLLCILFSCERAFVEPGGFEPPTFRVQGGRSPN
jgi:hypothetical protein